MPEAADLVAAADTLMGASLFNEAIATYTKAIELIPSPNYYIKRSTAYQRSGNYEIALKDAEEALKLAQERGKGELIADAQIRKGISLHGLKRFKESNAVFELVKQKGSKDKSIDIWIAKNNMELKKGSNQGIGSVPLAAKTPETSDSNEKSHRVKPSLDGADVQQPNETAIPATESTKPDTPVETPKAETAKVSQQAAVQRVRHEWYQSDQFVFVDMFFKNIPKDKCTVEFEPQSLLVTFPLPTMSTFTFTLDPLSNAIIPDQSTYQVLSTKLSLKLAKKVRGLKWTALENAPTTTLPTPTTSNTSDKSTKIAYPTSSRTGTKNWDAIEREAIEDAKAWEKPDGDAAANALFRDIYANASDDVKRAMMKSYIESNGTALSTDWSDVSQKKVETRPPESMVAKKWGE